MNMPNILNIFGMNIHIINSFVSRIIHFMSNKYLAPALDKGLDILEYLSKVAVPQSQVEIAQGLDKSPNEIYRMLVCLETRGYLLKNASSGKYSISLKLYQLAHRHSPVDGLVKTAKPFMEELSNRTKQSCHLGVLHHGELMVVSQMKSPGPVTLSIEEGSLFPLVKTTSGRVVLAFLDEKRRSAILKENKDFKKLLAAEKSELNAHLQNIKERGYEIEQSEITKGVSDIAVPIGNVASGIFAVLAISSLSTISAKKESAEFLIQNLIETASKLNASLGF